MKDNSQSKCSRSARHSAAGLATLLTALAFSITAGADINTQSKPTVGDSRVQDMKRLVSSADLPSGKSNERYFRCWQNGRLIIEESGLDYIPNKNNGKYWAFGSKGRTTKRLFVDGETTCLFSDERGLK